MYIRGSFPGSVSHTSSVPGKHPRQPSIYSVLIVIVFVVIFIHSASTFGMCKYMVMQLIWTSAVVELVARWMALACLVIDGGCLYSS